MKILQYFEVLTFDSVVKYSKSIIQFVTCKTYVSDDFYYRHRSHSKNRIESNNDDCFHSRTLILLLFCESDRCTYPP